TEVWYAPDRSFGALNTVLAQEVLAALVAEIRGQGYQVPNRGIKDDTTFRFFNGRYFPIFVLGPPRADPPPTSRATQMPGILGETLFLSNPHEAQLLVFSKPHRRGGIPRAVGTHGIRPSRSPFNNSTVVRCNAALLNESEFIT
ncbi:MAG: hypothetical protein NTZ05_19295, partial [Chloroflexi bacterium]|nr:hypothetical protein [Chloroflexota bacterium]